jgi:hypothetical protein
LEKSHKVKKTWKNYFYFVTFFVTVEIFNEDSKIEDIMELQCLMDVEIAKEKTVTHIEWFPGNNCMFFFFFQFL